MKNSTRIHVLKGILAEKQRALATAEDTAAAAREATVLKEMLQLVQAMETNRVPLRQLHGIIDSFDLNSKSKSEQKKMFH